MSPGWHRALAPAKVNLTLEVLGRRADGYHELRSWMLAIALHDEVAVRASERPGVRLARVEGDAPADPSNLVARAATSVLALAPPGSPPGLEVELVKRVPSGAGLGGGSSDAAAAWCASAAALGFEPDPSNAREALAALGSDCVFFLEATSGLARCSGRGEIVEPAPRARSLGLAVVTPELRCPTGEVYAAWRGPRPPDDRPEGWLAGDAGSIRARLRNDLEAAALACFPGLRAWRELLDARGCAHFRLSGSGSSFFGVFDARSAADSAIAGIRKEAERRRLGQRLLWSGPPAGNGARLQALS